MRYVEISKNIPLITSCANHCDQSPRDSHEKSWQGLKEKQEVVYKWSNKRDPDHWIFSKVWTLISHLIKVRASNSFLDNFCCLFLICDLDDDERMQFCSSQSLSFNHVNIDLESTLFELTVRFELIKIFVDSRRDSKKDDSLASANFSPVTMLYDQLTWKLIEKFFASSFQRFTSNIIFVIALFNPRNYRLIRATKHSTKSTKYIFHFLSQKIKLSMKPQ